jgi:peroxiredoxin
VSHDSGVARVQRRRKDKRAPSRGQAARVALSVAALACALPTLAAVVPSAAPDFVLKATDGRNLRLSEFRGDPVIVTFWGSWCSQCREALVTLDEVAKRTSTPVLGVNLDGSVERAASVAISLDLHFPTLVDERKTVARTYDVSRLPLTLLIDRDGTVRATWDGVTVPADELAGRLDLLRQE